MLHVLMHIFHCDTLFEKAILHHYRWLFLISNGNYSMAESTWQMHVTAQSELWIALNDPERYAPNISHKPIPRSANDLKPGV